MALATATRPGKSGADDSGLTLSMAEFRAIAERVHQRAGIVLGDSKRDLVFGRLGRRVKALGCDSFTEYLTLLDDPEAVDEQAAMINAITTNLTGFFRESHHFDMLAETAIPELMASQPGAGARRLRIWSP
jgi:chemotaxis protein methyltransferase CheR